MLIRSNLCRLSTSMTSAVLSFLTKYVSCQSTTQRGQKGRFCRNMRGRSLKQLAPAKLPNSAAAALPNPGLLLDAYQAAGHPLRYLPIDVSSAALVESSKQLLTKYPNLSIYGLVSTYEPALAKLPPAELPARMICFIGSTIGNLQPDECDAFLHQVSDVLRPGDYFLLGVDLQREVSVLEAAYNDAQGITAEFNLDMLRHLNQQFEGNFDVENFAHQAIYNKAQHQIEMYLESLKAQTVSLKALSLTVSFADKERLLSEISRKFDLDQVA